YLLPSSISSLSLHDALPISYIYSFKTVWDHGFLGRCEIGDHTGNDILLCMSALLPGQYKNQLEIRNQPSDHYCHRRNRRYLCGADRKSTRLNSSHVSISYAV